MIVTCQNCSASLQIDETKASSDRFAVRCPKCQRTIAIDLKDNQPKNDALKNSQPNAAQAPDKSPKDNRGTIEFAPAARDWNAAPAAVFKRKTDERQPVSTSADNNHDLMRLLSAVLQQQNPALPTTAAPRGLKRVLVCLNSERCEDAAKLLDEAGYTVFIADNPAQATEKIRDEEVDIIVYSPDFAVKFGGAMVVQKIVQTLLPHERRRLFVVSVEESSQTFNTHEAFLRNLNLIVNTGDVHHLPSILHRAIRDFEELFRHFNQAAAEKVKN